MDRTNEKAEYARIYGTSPCAYEMVFGHFNVPESYLGSRIENGKIVFTFTSLSVNDCLSAGNLIEHHFRARLSRKLSMNFGENVFSVPLPTDMDELDDYITAMFDLDLYFHGRPKSPRLQAELKLFNQNEDWRNVELVQEAVLSAKVGYDGEEH